MSTKQPTASDLSPRPTKRRKLQIACTQCRDRKTRCDGARPVCSTCDRRGKAAGCVYEQDELPTLQHVRDVESRLKRLEAQTHGQGSHFDVAAVMRPSESLPATANDTLAFDRAGLDVFPRNLDDSASSELLSHAPRLARDMSTTADLGTSHPREPTTTNKPTALCSSNPGFLRSIDSSWLIPTDGDKNTHSLPSVPKALWKRTESSMMLPRRPVADSLLHSFFAFAHEFLPIFHRPAFQRRYESLWVSSAPSRPQDSHEKFEDGVFLSTLNVCFALGSLFSELIADEDRESNGDEYYQRSRALTNFDVCEYSSLSTVRLQLVTGLYLQTTSYASRCWNVVGMAIRLAQDLGLHKDPSGHAQSDSVEVEMKRRVWYSCSVMDRLLASIYGRPPMISRASDVRLPSDVDRDYIIVDLDGVVSREQIPGASVFRQLVKLLNIFYEILETVYLEFRSQTTDSSGSRDADMLGKILKLNYQLDQCLASMSDRLCSLITDVLPTNSDRAYDFNLHEQALVTRFLHARIMLLRPLTLIAGHRNPQGSLDLESTVVRECCSLCLRSSELVVLSLRQDENSPRRLADWHAIYLMFTAATTFLAVARYHILPKAELQSRFGPFKENCVGILSSTNLRNTLVVQLESLLSFLQSVLFQEESIRNQDFPATTGPSEDCLTHIPTELATRPPEEYISPDSTLGISDVWNDLDFCQMLDQQFLDPSWLEDIQV